MRDLKRHTSEELHKARKSNSRESRREWMLWMMKQSAVKNKIPSGFQLWQPENHPIELNTNKIAHQKLDNIHNNLVEAVFVRLPENWLYSSAIDYYTEKKGLLEIEQLELLNL